MKITDINMRGITCSSEVINELMSMTIDRITTLKTLNLTKFPAMDHAPDTMIIVSRPAVH